MHIAKFCTSTRFISNIFVNFKWKRKKCIFQIAICVVFVNFMLSTLFDNAFAFNHTSRTNTTHNTK